MIRVHHLETSRSTRLIWALEELELDYELVTYRRDPVTLRAPDSAKALHPLGRFPLLEIDGKVIAESGAILTYLVEREGRLGAPDGGREDYTYWMHYAEGSAMTPLLLKLIMGTVRSARVPFLIKPIVRGVADKWAAAIRLMMHQVVGPSGKPGPNAGRGKHAAAVRCPRSPVHRWIRDLSRDRRTRAESERA